MQSIPDSGTCPKTAKTAKHQAHGATNRTGTCGSGCAEGPVDVRKSCYTAVPNVVSAMTFFLENQRLLQRVKACQNTSKHVMLQHQLQNSEGNIPTYSNPLAAKWNSSMNPQSCWALVRHCKSAFKDLKLHRFHLEVSRSPVFHGHRMAQACHSSMSVRSPTFPRRPESFSGPGVKYIRMSCRELFQDITRVQGWQDMTRSIFVRWVTLT